MTDRNRHMTVDSNGIVSYHPLGKDLEDLFDGAKPEEVSQKTDFKPTNPKDRAATSRLDISLFPQSALIYGALGMTEGDLKYGGYNFREAGVLVSVYVAALMRHLMKWYNGEEEDEKTGVPHLASVLACAAILVDSTVKGNLKDDRPPRAPVAELLADFEKKVKHLQELYPSGPPRHTEKK